MDVPNDLRSMAVCTVLNQYIKDQKLTLKDEWEWWDNILQYCDGHKAALDQLIKEQENSSTTGGGAMEPHS